MLYDKCGVYITRPLFLFYRKYFERLLFNIIIQLNQDKARDVFGQIEAPEHLSTRLNCHLNIAH